jgi:hypothetical protein|tara:strand:+ start:289 stop:483 length:195 start_codon:yes stop_codon:yes gene_type:complete
MARVARKKKLFQKSRVSPEKKNQSYMSFFDAADILKRITKESKRKKNKSVKKPHARTLPNTLKP